MPFNCRQRVSTFRLAQNARHFFSSELTKIKTLQNKLVRGDRYKGNIGQRTSSLNRGAEGLTKTTTEVLGHLTTSRSAEGT